MSEQGSTTTTTPGAQGAQGASDAGKSTTTAGPASVDSAKQIEVMQAELQAAHAKLDEFARDNAAYRDRERQRKTEEAEAKKKAGDWEPVLKERETTIADLMKRMAEIEPSAKAWAAHLEAESKAIAEAAKVLDADAQADIAAIADLGARRRLLDRLTKGRGSRAAGGLPDVAPGESAASKTYAEMTPAEMQKHEESKSRKVFRLFG